jgi:PAS domain-containing protein
MVWHTAAVVILGADGRYVDADDTALDLLGVPCVDALRAKPPGAFRATPRDETEALELQRSIAEATFHGLLAETPLRRADGEVIRVRTALVPTPGGGYRVLLYPVERPTTDLSARVYRITDVLAEWRSAERRLVDVDPTSAEGQQVMADVDLLREQYHELFRSRIGA